MSAVGSAAAGFLAVADGLATSTCSTGGSIDSGATAALLVSESSGLAIFFAESQLFDFKLPNVPMPSQSRRIETRHRVQSND